MNDQGESEELGEIINALREADRKLIFTSKDWNETAKMYGVNKSEAIEKLKQWRTKSLLSIIGEDEDVKCFTYECPDCGIGVNRCPENRAKFRNQIRAELRAALQDIKKRAGSDA